MSLLAGFLWTVLGGVVASLLHEATHYAVARALGRRARFRIREWAVYHESDSDGVTAADWAVHTAPLVIGLGATPLLVWLWWPPAPWIVVGWYIYTLHGALTNDLAFREADGEPAGSNANQ